MITTVRADLTWDGKIAKVINSHSEKKLKSILKETTGAVDIDIIDWNSWTEEDDEDWDK